MSLKTALASLDRPLTAGEQRVVSVLLVDDGADATALSVAKRAGTHETTVIRLARKLGYRGYPDLRADLKRKNGDASDAGDRVMRSATGADLRSFVADEVRALARIPDYVSQADLEATAQTVRAANRVYITGNNDARALISLLDRRLRRVGCTVVQMVGSARDISEHFVGFDSHSVLIAFVLKETPAYLPKVVAEAQRLGGKTVMIGDLPGFAFRPQPNHLLAAPRGSDPEYNTTLVPALICYALQLAIYHLDPERYFAIRLGIEDLMQLTGGQDEILLRRPSP